MSSQSGPGKSPLFYGAVLLVTASSVVFGLDWSPAPLPPMHETEASVKAAKAAAVFPPPVKRVVKAAPRVVTPTPASKPTEVAKALPRQDPSGMPRIMTPEQTAAPEPPQQPKCDIAACSASYRSFRASDCTWQPYEGPRRLCTKGTPPGESNTADADAGQQVSDKCDIDACKQAYFTFDPTDCTYQPYEGPRRLCTKGTPPTPATAAAPAATPAPADAAAPGAAAPAADAAPSGDQTQPKVSNKCDIDACKQAYFTFNPADCTYQPSDGPRRLCTKGNPPKPEAAAEPAAAPATPSTATPSTDAPSTATPAPDAGDAAAPASAGPAADAAPSGDQTQPKVSDKCDIDACKQAYFTFNPADCTYQPSDGPRRLCTKGNPPKPDAATEPAAAPATPSTAIPSTDAPSAGAPSTATPAPDAGDASVPAAAAPAPDAGDASAAAAPNADQAKPKCNIEACKQAYFTFNSDDCTYQPIDGPRRLCTKGAPLKPQAAAPAAAPGPRRAAPDHLVPPGLVPSGR